MTVLEVRDLEVDIRSGAAIVDDIDLTLEPGRILGLVGESGSGKTTVGMALMDHARGGARIAAGSVELAGEAVLESSPAQLRRIRGGVISYVMQDPSAALNPALKIGRQLRETLDVHDFGGGASDREARAAEVLAEVDLPSDKEFLARYPHQLSGGQQQRIVIALAFSCRPKVVVCDEPTTGLDVTTQAHVLRTIKALCKTHGAAVLYVSHDLAVVAEIADAVAVMYAGRIVEFASCEKLFAAPQHPYTQDLLSTIPAIGRRVEMQPIPGRAPAVDGRPSGCSFAPRCRAAVDRCTVAVPPLADVGAGQLARCIRAGEVEPRPRGAGPAALGGAEGAAPVLTVGDLRSYHGQRETVRGVSLEIFAKECVALVGESGSGKTTLAKSIIGLGERVTGTIAFEGTAVEPHARQRSADARRRMQYIFQSPYASLNPRRSVGETIALPLSHLFGAGRADVRRRAAAALEQVSLGEAYLNRFPRELSGGERQRVAIARALACEPALLICDEVTSALDVSVQAAIVGILDRLRSELGLAILFVTHNLALVRTIASRVLVMTEGAVVESGECAAVLEAPSTDYTRRLIADTPHLPAGVD